MAIPKPVYQTALSYIDLGKLGDHNKSIQAKEIQDRAYIIIRVKPDDAKSLVALKQCELELPAQLQSNGSISKKLLLWISPDHYLLIVSKSSKDQWLEKLDKVFKRRFATAIDSSGTYTQIKLEGEYLIAMLNKLVNYDLKGNFAKGKVISTLAGDAPVILVRANDKTILLLVRFSYSAYLAEALLSASQEYLS